MGNTSGPKGISDKRYEAALRKHCGIFADVGRELKISRQAVHQRVHSSEHLLRVCAECEEDVGDLAESGLVDNLKKKDMSAIRYYLDRKGKARGYVVSVRHEGTGENGEIEQKVTGHQTVTLSPETLELARRRIIDG